MKSLIFEELLLMSPVERKARAVEFHPQVTAIVGENDTGKSSLLKSIYWTLGADPVRQHPNWDTLNVASLLRFSIDGERFTAVRAGGRIALFDAKGACELATSQFTRELAPRLARHLGFALQLKSRKGVAEVPPPAFCFLPFYQDQDPGWAQPWGSFAALGQYADWKREVIAYHSGIRPNEYYELSAKKADLETGVNELEQERKALGRAYDKLKETKQHRPLVIDRAKYLSVITELLSQLQALEQDRQKVTMKLSELSNKRALLQQQAAIAQVALGELDKDYAFIKDDFSEHIMCPTCGTEHDNSFVNRYALTDDQEECRRFLVDVRGAIDDVMRDMDREKQLLGRANFRHSHIEKLLEERRGKLKLKDIIAAEGERQAIAVLGEELAALTERLAKMERELKDLKEDLKKFDDKDRKAKIENQFSGNMGAFLRDLNVHNLPATDYETIRSTVHDTGSDQPRAVLAYVYAFVATMVKYSSSPMCPMVLDTPNQQDQDQKNARAIIEFIFKRRPEATQVILGTVSLQGVSNPGRTVEMKEKFGALDKATFDEVAERMKPFLNAMGA